MALGVLLGAIVCSAARADEPRGVCSDAARQWAQHCGDSTVTVTPVTCLDGQVVFKTVVAGDTPLQVDVRRGAASGLLRAGGAAVSPVGDFADWGAESPAHHLGVERVAACLNADPSVLQPAAALRHAIPGAAPSGGSRRLWMAVLFAGTLGVASVLAILAFRRRRPADAAGSTREPVADPAPSAPAAARRSRPRDRDIPALVHLSFFGVCALVEIWAYYAADPDFPLLDPFHPLVAVLLVIYGASLLVRWRSLRYALVTVAIVLPALLLGMEGWDAARDRSIAARRLLVSNDRLLRYTYRPGVVVRGAGDANGVKVTDDGLLDVPHAVPKPTNVLRIVVLGDSVPNDLTMPFEKRFPKQLEALLARRAPGRRIEVINVSCEGYNTIQEVRLLERVGLRYEPDIVVVGYVLNDPFLQNGAYRRFGNSFFAFHAATMATMMTSGSCALFAPMHDGYAFDLVVRSSFERLRLLSQQHDFQVLVAPLPILAPFDDPVCLGMYDKVVGVARAQGFAAGRVVDAFANEDFHSYLKPEAPLDITHPNAAGHAKIAARLADLLTPLLDSVQGANP